MSFSLKVIFKDIVHKENPLSKAHPDDAGFDVRANMLAVVLPGERVLIKTGVHMSLPKGYCCFVQPRSGLALKHGITVMNSPGLIDSGYLNDCGVILYNTGTDSFVVNPGDRIAQFVFLKLPEFGIEQVESFEDTERGLTGFGQSGIK
jgi:dUTP pyrophosphatase